MRAAIYARFSSALQNVRSISDQIVVSRDLVARHNGEVVAVFEDRAISGSSMARRPGLLDLLDQAATGLFDTVVCEALDRLSRDQADIADIFKRLRYRKVRLLTFSEGYVESIHIGLKGTMNAMFLEELANKTRRGQRGRVQAGRIPGGLCYGYDVVTGTDDRGQRSINEAEAAVVRRIFRDYVDGRSGLQIAEALNREGVPGPRGRQWGASTINGSLARANGILNNRLYVGELVYNRQGFVKDPETGRRQARVNDPGAWLRQAIPSLRIVPQDLWEKAQAVKRVHGAKPLSRAARPRHALSGLLVCGVCGASYIVVSPARFGCSARFNKRTCGNGRTLFFNVLEQRIFNVVKEQLLAPDIVQAAIEEYRRAMVEKRGDVRRQRGAVERRLTDIAFRERHIVTLLEEGSRDKRLLDRLGELGAERESLETQLAAMDTLPVVELHPKAAESYRAIVADLAGALKDRSNGSYEAIARFRRLIRKVVIFPRGPRQPVSLEIHGDLAVLLGADGKASPGRMAAMVAGVGFEPTTFRL